MADRPDHNTGLTVSQDSQDSQGNTRAPPPAAGLTFAEAKKLDLAPFLKWVLENVHVYEDQDWGTPLFTLVRFVRSWCREDLKADAAFDVVDKVMRPWNAWSEHFDLDDEEAYTQFVETWKKIRWRVDESPLDIAAQRAKAFPLASHVKRGRPTPGYDRFFSLVGWLQFTMGPEKNIYLPVREIGERLQADIKMVSTWRQWALDDGFIEEVTPHDFVKRKATEFRVTAGHHQWLKGLIAKKL